MGGGVEGEGGGKEEINQSNHILLLLAQEIDTVAFFPSFPFSIKLVL